jgi:hypothetical protein
MHHHNMQSPLAWLEGPQNPSSLPSGVALRKILQANFRESPFIPRTPVNTATVKSIEPDAVMDSAASGFV